MRLALVVVVAACGSSAPPPAEPTPVEPAPPIDAPPPDAGPSAELAGAPAWVFRYSAPGRVETWTLRYHGETAMVVVEGQRTATYLGMATDGAELKIAVAEGPNHLTLACKRTHKAIGTQCNDTKAKQLAVLDCYHPDFEAPMTFGPAPGVEFVQSDRCNGYRLLP